MFSLTFALNTLMVGPGTEAMAAPITGTAYRYDTTQYHPSGTYGGAYPDDKHDDPLGQFDSGDLNDATLAGNSYADDGWVGIAQTGENNGSIAQPRLIFDLGASYDLNSVSIYYLYGGGSGIEAPDSVTVRYSNDDENFTEAAVFTGFDQGGGGNFEAQDTIDLTGAVGGTSNSTSGGFMSGPS